MRYLIKSFFKFLYLKWIKAQCRHLCKLCQYRNICDLYLEYEFDYGDFPFNRKKGPGD